MAGNRRGLWNGKKQEEDLELDNVEGRRQSREGTTSKKQRLGSETTEKLGKGCVVDLSKITE